MAKSFLICKTTSATVHESIFSLLQSCLFQLLWQSNRNTITSDLLILKNWDEWFNSEKHPGQVPVEGFLASCSLDFINQEQNPDHKSLESSWSHSNWPPYFYVTLHRRVDIYKERYISTVIIVIVFLQRHVFCVIFPETRCWIQIRNKFFI